MQISSNEVGRPRERLIEAELAVRYGVSRAPVREALRMLEQEGLVSKGPQGLEVADISLQEVSEIFELLAHLEELYTRRATPHLTVQDLRRLKSILVRMKEAIIANDVALYFASNEEFHRVIRNACPNGELIRLLDGLGKKTVRFRRLAMSLPGRLPKSLQEHRQIFFALTKKNPRVEGQRAKKSAERAFQNVADVLEHSLPIV